MCKRALGFALRLLHRLQLFDRACALALLRQRERLMALRHRIKPRQFLGTCEQFTVDLRGARLGLLVQFAFADQRAPTLLPPLTGARDCALERAGTAACSSQRRLSRIQ